jgi:hypothetical protein
MIEELAKTLGKSESEIKAMVETGQIGFDDVEKCRFIMKHDSLFKDSCKKRAKWIMGGKK